MSSFTSDLAGNVISEQVEGLPIGLGLDKFRNPSNDIRHYVGKMIVGSTKEVASGIGERLVSTTIETAYDAERSVVHGESAFKGIDLADRYKKVLSFEGIATDFVKGGSKEAVTSYIKERTPDPKTGLTPIIQSKLGYETNPETGLTGVVQDSLSHIVDDGEFSEILGKMEERNPSRSLNSAPPQTPDFTRTSLTPSEDQQIREMERNGEFQVAQGEAGPNYYSSASKVLTEQPIEITFSSNSSKYSEGEFTSQLTGQEEGLNQMSVADALDQMEQYRHHGRSDSAEWQKNYRPGIVETLIDERGEAEISAILKKDPSLGYERAAGMVDWVRLRQEAEEELSHFDALHDPDQNAGGDPSNIHGIGSSSVNRSIGSQWGHGRAEELYERIKAVSNGMSRDEMERTRLNIRLNYSVNSNS